MGFDCARAVVGLWDGEMDGYSFLNARLVVSEMIDDNYTTVFWDWYYNEFGELCMRDCRKVIDFAKSREQKRWRCSTSIIIKFAITV